MVMEGVRNIRDLGGIPVSEGRVARRRLIRSGSLHEATPRDLAELVALGVRTVIDLRSPAERHALGYRWPEVTVVAAPLVTDEQVAAITRGFETGTLTSRELEDWWSLTGVYEAPFEHLGSIRTVFEVIGEADAHEAVLFHCRGGKDRTGLVAALVLEALGADRGEIFADFLASDGERDGSIEAAEFRSLRVALEARGLSPRAISSLIGVRAEWLDRLIGGIEAQCGSVERYLTDSVGLGTGGLEELRRRYVV